MAEVVPDAHPLQFAIEASTGQIGTAGSYDYEKTKGYAVIVRASYGKAGRVNLVVKIAVKNVRDQAWTCSSLSLSCKTDRT